MDELSPLEEAFLASLSPEAQGPAREALIKRKQQGSQDPDDPDIWEFNNPFVNLWTGGDATKVGYTKKKASKAELDFYTMPKEQRLRFQELAFQAGLYGASAEREDIPWGARDTETFKIWQQMVGQAARYAAAGKQTTIWDALQDLVDNRPEGLGKKNKGRAPLVTELPDPRAVEEMVRGVAPSVIGRDADPAFTSDFIAMYTKIVSEFQANKYALQGTEEGGTITAPPSAEALASFRLRTENPGAYEEARAAERHKAYSAMLKGIL
jgi:hypothetical protein